MEDYIKGALVGGIWGFLSMVPMVDFNPNDNSIKNNILKVIAFPGYVTYKSKICNNLSCFGISAIIGVGIGYGITKLMAKDED